MKRLKVMCESGFGSPLPMGDKAACTAGPRMKPIDWKREMRETWVVRSSSVVTFDTYARAVALIADEIKTSLLKFHLKPPMCHGQKGLSCRFRGQRQTDTGFRQKRSSLFDHLIQLRLRLFIKPCSSTLQGDSSALRPGLG